MADTTPAAATDAAPATATTPATTTTAPATGGPATTPEEAKKQVFVGNLAFATTEADLKTLFAEAGSVTSAQIITRGTRSLGYAFVTFASEADAAKAVEILNKREVAGREINVEGAKPQAVAASKKAANADGAANGDEGAGGKRAGRGGARSGRGAGRGGRGGARGGAAAGGAARKPRPAKEDGAAPTGEPSPTLIFVANLPFSTTDDELKAAFAQYKVASAFVAKRFGRKSKGYGFVDAESHEEQQRIINESKGLTIEGREVQLRVALNKSESSTKEGGETPAQDGAAATTEAPAAAASAAPAATTTDA